MNRLGLALCLLLAIPAWAEPTALGRLFFTPDKRAALDRQRQLNLTQLRDAESDNPLFTLNGTVRRSNGRQTTWINGAPLEGNTTNPRDLMVGDSMNGSTGEKSSLLRGGSIRINPRQP